MITTIATLLAAALAGGLVAAIVNSLLAPRLNSYFTFRSKRREVLQTALYELLCLHANCEFKLSGRVMEWGKAEYKKSAVEAGFQPQDVDRVFKVLQSGRASGEDWKMSEVSERHFSKKIQEVASSLLKIHPTVGFYLNSRHGGVIIDLNLVKGTKFPEDVMGGIVTKRMERLRRDIHLISILIGPLCWMSTRFVLWQVRKDDTNIGLFLAENLVKPESRKSFEFLLQHIEILEKLNSEKLLPPRSVPNTDKSTELPLVTNLSTGDE